LVHGGERPDPLGEEVIQIPVTLRRPTEYFLPHLPALHAEVDKEVGFVIPQPADHLPIHPNSDGFKIPKFPIVTRKELPQKDLRGGKSITDDRFQGGGKPKSP
jgi:hypothetical protein